MSDIKNQAQLPLFVAIFNDGTKFSGGNSYYETKWMSIPHKQIKRLFYKLPSSGDYLCLEYDKYFHLVEATNDLSGKRKGIVTLEYVYIMGKKNSKVTSYRITLKNKNGERYHQGDVTIRNYDESDKFIQKLNINNWK